MVFGDKAEGKMGTATCLQLLTHMEATIDFYLQDFKDSELIDEQTVTKESKQIFKVQKQKYKEENMKKKEEEVKELQRKR